MKSIIYLLKKKIIPKNYMYIYIFFTNKKLKNTDVQINYLLFS